MKKLVIINEGGQLAEVAVPATSKDEALAAVITGLRLWPTASHRLELGKGRVVHIDEVDCDD
jgi:hypothetical protein